MNLIEKYNVPVPRYTSYPTVPYWDTTPTQEQWKKLVSDSFIKTNQKNGISLYIHLPFCESLCTYCACNTRITVNHKVEMPYITAILKEWQLYLNLFSEKPKITEIHLGGGTPTFFSADNLKFLLTEILKTVQVSEDAEFSFEGHPGNTTREHLQTLFDIGFKRVSYGIQDFDDKVQDAINRYQSFDQVKEVVDLSREIGYTSINFDLVYGLPFQTKESVTNTIKLVNQLNPDRIAFYSYAHVPWLKPGQRRYTEKDLPDDAEKRALYDIGLELFKQNNYLEIGMDHFSKKEDSLYQALQSKKIHRNFMGYTHHYTELMIGLGASSISDTWNGFSQNIKTVEEYQEKVNQGEFPIFKGHILSEQDLLIRKHILNMMCFSETTLSSNQLSEQNTANLIMDRLEDIIKDELISSTNSTITLTHKGKPFLRNVCMAFDERYWNKLPKTNLFSKSV